MKPKLKILTYNDITKALLSLTPNEKFIEELNQALTAGYGYRPIDGAQLTIDKNGNLCWKKIMINGIKRAKEIIDAIKI
jgi:hypothetical protein